MFGKTSAYALIAVTLFLAWNFYSKKIPNKYSIGINWIIILFLVCFVTFREATLNGDYSIYVQYFKYPKSYLGEVENSFFNIRSIVESVSGSFYLLLFIYALLGVVLKYFAIKKYSSNFAYSFCIWISFAFLLQDMVQIRVAVSSGLMLWTIPLICQQKRVIALILIVIAFYFHNSAVVLLLFLFLDNKTIRPNLWISVYVVLFIINVLNVNLYGYILQVFNLLPTSLSGRIGFFDPDILGDSERLTLYSRYILIPTIITFISLFYRDRLQRICPYTILCVKSCFLAIYAYGLSVPILSVRIFELLLIPLIYLFPLCLYWYRGNYAELLGKSTATVFCLFMAWNLLFKQEIFG